MSQPPEYFRRCSTCKAEIGFSREYYLCSVSTCNRKRIGLFFCSVPCWDAHVPEARHRDAWAEPQRSPTREEWARALAAEAEPGPDSDEEGRRDTLVSSRRDSLEPTEPRRRVVVAGGGAPGGAADGGPPQPSRLAPAPVEDSEAGLPRDVLVVVSKLKSYVKAHGGMNTSDGVVDVLSDHLRSLCREAVREAARQDRKTVMDRDFLAILRR